MKLNKRLLNLSEMVTSPYHLVWDCCCDHGLLGFKILADGLVKQVNFVDLVPAIIDKLDKKLSMYAYHLPNDVSWNTFCQDVASLQLMEDKHQSQLSPIPKQLVIISGVGGELMIDMLEGLMQRYRGYNIDYLLCPVQHTYKLRTALIKLNFKLKEERLVVENKRGYELLLVNQVVGKEISLSGKKIWEPKNSHKQYLVKLIAHYQRMESSDSSHKLSQLDQELNTKALMDYRLVLQEYYQNTVESHWNVNEDKDESLF
ncbi:SAM-dependent methyltransferase [Psychromonas sp. RZ22]|uniref:tRNA (adenine(22)-N(1))-methyltransferase n=1 Tax=Psychromonas algarum TaxID=2555643 RepID=UPI001068D220|nr:tRNA (adenine(22)-N(1))-methyltransferase TrmK [Psychromonas sp. RZ22]TEW55923.1 SAM-dependent methyltransferase [Psychromonas sp. RZ22]